MRRFVRWLGWVLSAAAAVLILLGLATWPPGGLMFALPYVFLIPGAVLAVVGGLLVWAGSRGRTERPPTRDCC
jgi:hypothetical protein